MIDRLLDIFIYNARTLNALNLYIHNDPVKKDRKVFRVRNVGERPVDIIEQKISIDDDQYQAKFDDGNLSLIVGETKTLRVFAKNIFNNLDGLDLEILRRSGSIKRFIFIEIKYRPLGSLFNKKSKFIIDSNLQISRK